MSRKIDEIACLLETAGAHHYGMEAITQLEHALQCAMHAERAGGTPYLIVASLLHDIGHLIGAGDEGQAEAGVDAAHEETGADWLRDHFGFGAAVVEPVRLHVAAKRYLCNREPLYLAGLSQASVTSLNVQGGVYTDTEAREFESRPFFQDAVMLRRWDEKGKVRNLKTPDMAHYMRHVATVLETNAPPHT